MENKALQFFKKQEKQFLDWINGWKFVRWFEKDRTYKYYCNPNLDENT